MDEEPVVAVPKRVKNRIPVGHSRQQTLQKRSSRELEIPVHKHRANYASQVNTPTKPNGSERIKLPELKMKNIPIQAPESSLEARFLNKNRSEQNLKIHPHFSPKISGRDHHNSIRAPAASKL